MRTTLRQVFAQHQRISVPLIQRDYAHGRPAAKDVIARFLEALKDALIAGSQDRNGPLNLDFVYGTPDPSGDFCPLDGQQRMTTLFLLHWYLANLDGLIDEFREWAVADSHSAFSYKVRPSSQDFFDVLVRKDIDLQSLIDGSRDSSSVLSGTIQNQPWFFLSWQLDPTIRSCLVVLDEIHHRFLETSGLYTRLISPDSPAITFEFLDLQHFGLTDDLYIKMNARGKPLTEFEHFKANFEQYVGKSLPGHLSSLNGISIPTRNYVAQMFDTRWGDLFWQFRTERIDQDELAMNGIRSVALVVWARNSGGLKDHEINETLNDLRTGEIRSFYDYERSGCLSKELLEDLIALFDQWTAKEGFVPLLASAAYYDERDVLRRVLGGVPKGRESVTYSEWVQFAAWCEYLLSDHPATGLHEWMRVICNLAGNTVYNRADEFRTSLQGMRRLLAESDQGLLTQVATAGSISGFNRQQVREERLKAQLLLQSEEWRDLIEGAETHRYFRGQVEFLLDFSGVLNRWLLDQEQATWADQEDEEYRRQFAWWLRRAESVFVDGIEPGLRDFPEYVWERTLLCEGDYLLRNNTNFGFLDNTDRELSWKRLLRSDLNDPIALAKRQIVARVLSIVDPDDVEESLRTRISEGVRGSDQEFPGWRQRLVEYPALIGYCGKRQIRFVPGDSIYLLSKSRRNGRHLELFTSHLEHRLRPILDEGALSPFDTIICRPVMTDTETPCLSLVVSGREHLCCEVTYRDGVFEVKALHEFRPAGLQAEDPWFISPDEIEVELVALAERIRALA